MTIEEAFKDLISTDGYKSIAKKKDAVGSKYRIYKGRFEKGTLKVGAMVEILLRNGYRIIVTR